MWRLESVAAAFAQLWWGFHGIKTAKAHVIMAEVNGKDMKKKNSVEEPEWILYNNPFPQKTNPIPQTGANAFGGWYPHDLLLSIRPCLLKIPPPQQRHTGDQASRRDLLGDKPFPTCSRLHLKRNYAEIAAPTPYILKDKHTHVLMCSGPESCHSLQMNNSSFIPVI